LLEAELSSNPAVVEGKLKELEKRADEVWTQLMDIEMLQVGAAVPEGPPREREREGERERLSTP
jgi:hypothetical protein